MSETLGACSHFTLLVAGTKSQSHFGAQSTPLNSLTGVGAIVGMGVAVAAAAGVGAVVGMESTRVDPVSRSSIATASSLVIFPLSHKARTSGAVQTGVGDGIGVGGGAGVEVANGTSVGVGEGDAVKTMTGTSVWVGDVSGFCWVTKEPTLGGACRTFLVTWVRESGFSLVHHQTAPPPTPRPNRNKAATIHFPPPLPDGTGGV